MLDSLRPTKHGGKVTESMTLRYEKVISGMISSNTTVKYHAVFLYKLSEQFVILHFYRNDISRIQKVRSGMLHYCNRISGKTMCHVTQGKQHDAIFETQSIP